jgi:hypothetical protein
MVIMGIAISSFGATSCEATSHETIVTAINNMVFKYIGLVIPILLFIWFIFRVIEAMFIRRDQEHNWFGTLAILIVMVVVSHLEGIFTGAVQWYKSNSTMLQSFNVVISCLTILFCIVFFIMLFIKISNKFINRE